MIAENDKLKIVSVMSVPMCGWNPHWGCHLAATRPFEFADEIVAFGCWWDHSISNSIEDVLDQGADWILTMDYDSMFTADHLSALMKRFGDNPHIDALAPIQPRRGDDPTPLMTRGSETSVSFGSEPIEADTAHFGLTLFRAESFAKMSKPWFLHEPDKNGSYRSKSRTDPDIYFWRKWKDSGNTLFVDPLVSIGHLQPMVAEMVRDDSDGFLKTQYIHFMEWRKRSFRVVEEVAA